MVNKLRTLDILLQLQGELFEDTLKEAVRVCFMVLSHLTFNHQFNEVALPTAILQPKLSFPEMAKDGMLGWWKCSLIIFAYKKHTGEMVSIDDMRDGHLGPKLQGCDFDTDTQVKLLVHSVATPI